MTRVEIEEKVLNHVLWLEGKGGSQADFSHANLRFADLSNANLKSVNFSNAVLNGAYLNGSDLSHAFLNGADLSGANLGYANLSGAYLHQAILSDAKLYGANLQEAKNIKYAQCSFAGFGERNRMLTVVEIDGALRWFCGCFEGSTEELEKYIAAGKEEMRSSRRHAMAFLLSSVK